MQEMQHSNPFQSYWMGGFECSDQLNSSGDRVDFLHITDHFDQLDQDYKNLKLFGIETVREGIRWSQVEKIPYQYDFSTVKIMMEVGNHNNIQQVWDICHFGFPDDLSPLHPHFTKRFTAVCAAFAKFHRRHSPHKTLIVTPINEVSFISWLGGDVAGTSPFAIGNGWNVKYALMRAYIQGIYAMKKVDPLVRILTTEPLVNIVPPESATDSDVAAAAEQHENQFQALDILGGYICPELGGSPELLDLLGFNFYYNNQWVLGLHAFLPWLNEENDPRWTPLSKLLTDAYDRYKRPIVLTETSHPREDRPKWVKFIAQECNKVLSLNIPFFGICLYPIIDRPDWDNLHDWHHSGLWDDETDEGGSSNRTLNEPYAKALLEVQELPQEDVKVLKNTFI
jgi:hypothetical protein